MIKLVRKSINHTIPCTLCSCSYAAPQPMTGQKESVSQHHSGGPADRQSLFSAAIRPGQAQWERAAIVVCGRNVKPQTRLAGRIREWAGEIDFTFLSNDFQMCIVIWINLCGCTRSEQCLHQSSSSVTLTTSRLQPTTTYRQPIVWLRMPSK